MMLEAKALAAPDAAPPLDGLASGRMTEAEYDAAREALRAKYGDSSAEAAAKRDQALAALFADSGWPQEELAAKEGKTKQWISQRIKFGMFLNYSTTVANAEPPPANLTERRFRGLWQQTGKDDDDQVRFQEVYALMQAAELSQQAAPEGRKNRPRIGKDIREKFGDGKWHKPAVIAERLGADVEHVEKTLKAIQNNKTYDCRAESKQVGKGFEYRIFQVDTKKPISLGELTTKLTPIVEELEIEGRKALGLVAPPTIATLAAKIRLLLDELAK